MKRHYDTAEIRRVAEEANAAAIDGAMRSATTDRGRRGVELQARFSRLIIDFVVLTTEAANDGIEENLIAKAVGAMLGNMSGNYMKSALAEGGIECVLLMQMQMDRTLKGILSEVAPDGSTLVGRNVQPMQGGHA